jgi:hypothetical protein
VGYDLGDGWSYEYKEGPWTFYTWHGPNEGQDTIVIEIESYYGTLEIGAEQEFELKAIKCVGPGIFAHAYTTLEIVTSMEISGTYLDCSNPASYDLENPATGSNPSWVIKQGAITRASGSGTTASANNLTDGEVKVTFTTNFTCSLDDLTFKDYFWFGKPVPSILGSDEVECYFPEWYFTDGASHQWGDFEWSTDYMMHIIGTTTGHKAKIEGLDEGYGQIFLEVTNTCGSKETRKVVWIDCDFFRMAPNPSDDYVEISLDETKVDFSSIKEYEVKIYNAQQILISNIKTKSSSIRIDTSHLKNGTYYVHLIYNGKTYVRQLVVSH